MNKIIYCSRTTRGYYDKEGCRIFKKILCLFLSALFILSLAGCGAENGGFRILETYESDGGYVIAFRENDALCDIITAALHELAANGTLRTVSLNWFGEDLNAVKAEGGAIEEYRDSLGTKTLMVGVITGNKPLSYANGEGYSGYDVDLANYICGFLGWSMEIRPISADDIGVQLASGNIDCAMGVPSMEKTDDYSYSPEYLSGKYVLVTRLDGAKSRLGLRGAALGITTADVDLLKLNEKFVSHLGSVIYQTGTESLFEALDRGEVDAILVSNVMAIYYMR